ncbi:hypothetical protein NQ318_015821 [Aromia moschata]|uniref:5'-nucleotidase domain-containing protein 3 n=1 Tax=Aromia moschata TaxID=1265417 RepID=A0AAV8YRG0_9CUCU|nr:hypothetical protein NQ318_015821 [Aromia moschata]
MLLCRFINNKRILRSGYALYESHVLEKLKILCRFHSQRRLEEAYKVVKTKCQSKKLPKDVNPKAVFACNELDLKEVKVYGFDYDYTLACYKPSLDYLLYNLGRQNLIEQFKYPRDISNLEYQPGFAIRGLHYDIEKGVLLKLDSFLQIQFGSVYKGLSPLSNEEVLKLYKNRIIPIAYVEGHTKNASNAVRNSHPVMHQIVAQNVSEYIENNDRLRHKGMEFMVGPDWKEYFDVLIVQARKPRFFTDVSRPIRVFDEQSGTHIWDRVTKLEKGVIYYEGTVKQLQELTGWRGHQVLYFGDHPYSDLADVTLEHGWKTGAIITELTHEIATLNDPVFKKNANWLQMLTQLIEDHQDCEDPEEQRILAKWMGERDRLRNDIKYVFNKQFGSVFRTYHNPTYFSRRLFRFADIYTSNISNLLNYSVNHTFYPRRGVMPHEYISYFV